MGEGKKKLSELDAIRRDLSELVSDMFMEAPTADIGDKLWEFHGRAKSLAERLANVRQDGAAQTTAG